MLAGLARVVRRSTVNLYGDSPPTVASKTSLPAAKVITANVDDVPDLASEGSAPAAGPAAGLIKARRNSGSASAPCFRPVRTSSQDGRRSVEALRPSPKTNVQLAPLRSTSVEAQRRKSCEVEPPRGGYPSKPAPPKAGGPLPPDIARVPVHLALQSASSVLSPNTSVKLAPLPPEVLNSGQNQVASGNKKKAPATSPTPGSSPAESPDASPGASPSATPRTPRALEVSVEGQEAILGAGVWTADGDVEARIGKAKCTITVKAGLVGRSGISAVLRVGLATEDDKIVFKRSSKDWSVWQSSKLSGSEECDIGKLPMKTGTGSPRTPRGGVCLHCWQQSTETVNKGPGAGDNISVDEALSLDAASCGAHFRCGLDLRVKVSCIVQKNEQALLRVDVEGQFNAIPTFYLIGRAALTRFYLSARDAYMAADDDVALQLCERGLSISSTIRPRPPELGDMLNMLGAVHLRRTTPDLAIKCLEGALSVRLEHAANHDDPNNMALAGTLSTLGSAHLAIGSLAEAHQCHKQAVILLEKCPSVNGTLFAAALHNLADTMRARGNLEEARNCYERALKHREVSDGKDHPTCARTLNNLGTTFQQLLLYQDAIVCYQRALAIQTKANGRDHPVTASTLSNLGSAHSALGDHNLAVACHTRALSVQEKQLGKKHVDVAATLHNLGNAVACLGRGQMASNCFWKALEIWTSSVGHSHPDVASTLHSLGNVYRGINEPGSASECFAGALRIREATLGPTHAETARTRHCAALVGCSLGDGPAASQELQAAVNSLVAGLGARHPWTLQACADLEALKKAMASPRSHYTATPRSLASATSRNLSCLSSVSTPRVGTSGEIMKAVQVPTA